jgi:hypothetical protein
MSSDRYEGLTHPLNGYCRAPPTVQGRLGLKGLQTTTETSPAETPVRSMTN